VILRDGGLGSLLISDGNLDMGLTSAEGLAGVQVEMANRRPGMLFVQTPSNVRPYMIDLFDVSPIRQGARLFLLVFLQVLKSQKRPGFTTNL
jgi:hypothetical protein